MEILFKDDSYIFGIEKERLRRKMIAYNLDINLSNIPHLDDVEVLYHYSDDINNGEMLPVYYERNGKFITEYGTGYDILKILPGDIKDYTLVNTKLLDNI